MLWELTDIWIVVFRLSSGWQILLTMWSTNLIRLRLSHLHRNRPYNCKFSFDLIFFLRSHRWLIFSLLVNSFHRPANHESSDQSMPLPFKNPPTGEEMVSSQNPYVSSSNVDFSEQKFLIFFLLLSRDDVFCASFQTVRDVLFCSKENINFVHEIFRQAFLLPFNCSPAIRRTIAVHKDWIQMNVSMIFIPLMSWVW